jgi:putative endonuclease
MTDNIERRFEEHKSGKGGFFTRTAGVEKLLYNEEFSGRLEAHKRESQLKRWPRRKKLALINGDLDC